MLVGFAVTGLTARGAWAEEPTAVAPSAEADVAAPPEPSVAPEKPVVDEAKPDAKKKKKKGDKEAKAKPPVTFGAQVYAAYKLSDVEPIHSFEIRRARLSLELDPVQWFCGQLEVDFSAGSPLKDAFGTLRLSRYFEVTAGQFKKPFSRIELMGARKLEFFRRGITNERIISDDGFGGRDLGVMVAGEVAMLGYSLGVFNGNGTAAEFDSGKDFALRLTLEPVKFLELGVSGAMQYRNQPEMEWPRNDIWAAGVDARLRLKPVDVVLEALWAQGGTTARGPQRLGVVLYAVVDLKLTNDIELRPVLKTELLDDNLWKQNNLAFSMTAGANLRLWKMVRVMLQGELVLHEAASGIDEEKLVLLQLAFDHKFGLALNELWD
jgi:hypothetical protein